MSRRAEDPRVKARLVVPRGGIQVKDIGLSTGLRKIIEANAKSCILMDFVRLKSCFS